MYNPKMNPVMSRKKKEKQVSKEEYIETYCGEKRIRGRYAVYVSKDAHDNLRKIAGHFKMEYHTTTSSLADAIITHHFEANEDLLNGLLKEDWERFFTERRNRTTEMEEDQEEEDYDDDLPPS
jgi:predicted ArsR family transcriptional regulator